MADKKMDIKIVHRTTVQNFIDSIYLDHDDDVLFGLIAGIDEAAGDWDFTEKCRDHFVRQMEIKELEDAENKSEQDWADWSQRNDY